MDYQPYAWMSESADVPVERKSTGKRLEERWVREWERDKRLEKRPPNKPSRHRSQDRYGALEPDKWFIVMALVSFLVVMVCGVGFSYQAGYAEAKQEAWKQQEQEEQDRIALTQFLQADDLKLSAVSNRK